MVLKEGKASGFAFKFCNDASMSASLIITVVKLGNNSGSIADNSF